jgi:hypothetical protein
MQQGIFMSSGVPSNVPHSAPSKESPNSTQVETDSARNDQQINPLRTAFGFLIATLILAPGGFRALRYAGLGWESWSFSPAIILTIIAFHLIFCWTPLALRYFKRGECPDLLAFIVATVTLFLQILMCYGLVQNYSVWHGA